MPSDPTTYLDRLEIGGVLELVTPLHVGCGETERSDRVLKRLRKGGEPEPVEVAQTIRDQNERPCIPGSTLKGCLLDLCAEPEQLAVRDRLFGFSRAEGSNDADKRWMGRLLVWTARLRDRPNIANRPYADAERGTFVDSRTKIDPATGTADVGEGAGGQLFNVELVGPGATFDLRLTLLGPSDADLTALGTLLGRLKEGVVLGCGSNLGQGRIRLRHDGLTATRRTLSSEGVWRQEAQPLAEPKPDADSAAPACPCETLELRCDGPYLTLDGSHEPTAQGEPQLVALVDHEGQPILNGSSVIGALRTRCRWLARQDDASIGDDPKLVLRWLEPPSVLTSVERLFGVAGWGSCVAVEQIEPIGCCERIELTSVSIDRFTGGPRDGALFKTRTYLGAAFRIGLTLRDRDGIEQADRDLFNSLIDDLRRNGIMLGHGAAKGFGWFRDASRPLVDRTAHSILADLPEVPEPAWNAEDKKKLDGFERRSAKAPYSFVPLNKQVVTVSDFSRHDQPAQDQFSGWIELAWIAETPLLLGVENDAGIIESFRLGKAGLHAIPGASLRGMVRAVFEIATFSKLGAINGHHRFALRDFKHERYKRLVMQPKGGVQAGWLQRRGGGWQIVPCSYRRIDHEEIASHTGVGNGWRSLDLEQKMHKLTGKLAVRFVALEADLASLDLAHTLGVGVPQDGTLVVAGIFVPNKRYETVFFDDRPGAAFNVPDDAIEELDFVYSRTSKKGREPEGNWAYWKDKAEAGQAVPVFFVGQPGWAEFHVGLSRLFRLSHGHSVGEVAADQQDAEDALDMTEALFGYVRDPAPETGSAALKGRVFFEYAPCLNDDQAASMEPQTTVLLGPRASFAPYYLLGEQDWSGRLDRLRLAGRKRYPARGASQELPKPPTASVASTLRFIAARGAEPLVFGSRIRVHNLSPIELGGLLWALTFGGRASTHRHMIGRAKPYGHGQLRVAVQTVRADDGRELDAAARHLYLHYFTRYMEERVQKWVEQAQIRQLLATADPAIGAELLSHLTYPGDFDGYAKVRNSGGRLARYPDLVRG